MRRSRVRASQDPQSDISRLIDFSFMVSLFDKVVNYIWSLSSIGLEQQITDL